MVVESVDVASGVLAECERATKRGAGCVVFVLFAFDIRDLWPGDRRRSGSGASASRRRLGEDGEKSVLVSVCLACSCEYA